VRRRLIGQEGAVSVYLILILAPLILFVMLLIDYARMKASELQAEQAVRAGVRSVLSAYDPTLANWGLFGLGIDAEKAQTIFRDVVETNLTTQSEQGAFAFAEPRIGQDGVRIAPMYMLSNHIVFKKQVLEEMKYRAPIEFALEITDKFKGNRATSSMKDGDAFASRAQQFEQLIDKREEALDEAWETTTDLHEDVIRWHGEYGQMLQQLRDLAAQIGSETVEAVTARLHALNDQSPDGDKSEEDDQDDSERERLEQILSWIGEYASLLGQIKIRAMADYDRLTQSQRDIDESIGIARTANEQLQTEVDRVRSGPDQTELAANDVFAHIRIYDTAYFGTFQSGAGAVAALFAGFRSDLETIQLYYGANYDQASKSNEAYFTKSESFYGQQQAVENDRQRRNEERNGAKKTKRSEIENVFRLAKAVTGDCGTGDTYKSKYDRLEGGGSAVESDGQPLFSKYMSLNQQNEGGAPGADFELEKADGTTSKSMRLLGTIADLLESARNELYMNEYALTQFNYRTYGLEPGADGQPRKDRSLSKPSEHALVKQEAEYLLYGFSSCQANLSTAYAEMFGFRFAIRTLEQLSEPRNELLNVGSPLLVLLSAAAQGAVQAYEDMSKLVQGEAVEISAKLTGSLFKMTYKDYLRLFMLLHSNDAKLMSRMQALIELNTGIDLARTPTYVEGNADVSATLWFSSTLMKALKLSGTSQCAVTRNQCTFVKTAAMSY